MENEIIEFRASKMSMQTTEKADIKNMLEKTFSDISVNSESSFYHDPEVSNLREKLRELKSDQKFRYFIKLNDLDPCKILSMTDAELGIPNVIKRSLTKDSIDTIGSIDDDIELTIEDYAKFSYIISRLLDLEEKLRLKTEEQYNSILEHQISR